jgi:hypothetical protein
MLGCNGRDMLTWAGAQEGMGFQNAKAFPKDIGTM